MQLKCVQINKNVIRIKYKNIKLNNYINTITILLNHNHNDN